MKKIMLLSMMILALAGCSAGKSTSKPTTESTNKPTQTSSEVTWADKQEMQLKQLTKIAEKTIAQRNKFEQTKLKFIKETLSTADLKTVKEKDKEYKNVKEIYGKYSYEGKESDFDLILSFEKPDSFNKYTVIKYVIDIEKNNFSKVD
ncbi:hypothetical protein [Enterococcus villorum]|uniref:Lipoprotein n=2 Tax=Enterococcus villorum TaxID=112904 RepID=A0A511J3I5_9ENTE|nr:hypothetical protein [Enterococcus villorum]EOH91961.1 hypothetical protein UAO_00632 [Enterococcus villorum ATCC 700913]EOW76677.1 hypothetical protein I591_01985 [Enterococcus villorum ATCC 700913]GEL92263.1 hypothetical protein EVI01_16000 [Enterococcus villorum]